MKIYYLFVVIALSLSRPACSNEGELTILINGEKQKVLKAQEIKELKSVKIDYYNYASRKSASYKGVPFFSLMNSAVPNLSDKIVEVELISKNGYKTYFPFESFIKIDSVLTYDTADNEKFERYSQKEKAIVPLGPYYLVWDFKTLGKEDKYLYGSVYQITQINFINNKVDFGISGSKVDESVIIGFRTYKRYCLSCHAIDSWGGDLSIDLTKKKNLEQNGNSYVIKYALDPSSLNPNTKMLPLPKYKNRLTMAEGIVDFLNFSRNADEYIKSRKIQEDKTRYDSFKEMMNEMRNKK